MLDTRPRFKEKPVKRGKEVSESIKWEVIHGDKNTRENNDKEGCLAEVARFESPVVVVSGGEAILTIENSAEIRKGRGVTQVLVEPDFFAKPTINGDLKLSSVVFLGVETCIGMSDRESQDFPPLISVRSPLPSEDFRIQSSSAAGKGCTSGQSGPELKEKGDYLPKAAFSEGQDSSIADLSANCIPFIEQDQIGRSVLEENILNFLPSYREVLTRTQIPIYAGRELLLNHGEKSGKDEGGRGLKSCGRGLGMFRLKGQF
jgi:hypothetical protein